ncbi:hypothetical protein ACOTVP_08730 [Aliarcobacter butzleri]
MENNQKEIILLKDLGMLYSTEFSKEKKRYGIYKCFCGKEFKTQVSQIKNGYTKSCGCNKNKNKIKHNLSSHRLYNLWNLMINRCNNKKRKAYKDYGGRGIIVCEEWENDFIAFYNWSINNGYKENLTIDRVDNNKGYSPNNCRWVSRSIQSRNNRKIRINNTSGYRGASWHKGINKFVSTISVDSKKIHIGIFDTLIEAAKAYDKYVIDNKLEHTINGVI